MLSKYRPTIDSLPASVKQLIRRELQPAGTHQMLYSGLQARGLSQADVVMVLLPHRAEPEVRAAIDAMVGAPVTVCPPAVPPWPPHPVRSFPRQADDRRVTMVGPNPRLPTTPSWTRFRAIRRGLTVTQLLSRGVTRKDLRELVRGKHIALEVLP